MTIPPKTVAGLIAIGLAAGVASCGGGGGSDMGPAMTAATAPPPAPPMTPSQMATTDTVPDQRAEPAPPADVVDTTATPRM